MDSEIVSTRFLFPYNFCLLPICGKTYKILRLERFFLLIAQLHKRPLVNASFKYHVVSSFASKRKRQYYS